MKSIYDELYDRGYNIFNYTPKIRTKKPKVSKKKRIPVYIEGLGTRYFTGLYNYLPCQLHDDCFTCPIEPDKCKGGDRF